MGKRAIFHFGPALALWGFVVACIKISISWYMEFFSNCIRNDILFFQLDREPQNGDDFFLQNAKLILSHLFLTGSTYKKVGHNSQPRGTVGLTRPPPKMAARFEFSWRAWKKERATRSRAFDRSWQGGNPFGQRKHQFASKFENLFSHTKVQCLSPRIPPPLGWMTL